MNVKPNIDDKRSRHVKPNEMPWDKMRFPGCETKTLLFDPKSGLATVLIKMEPWTEAEVTELQRFYATDPRGEEIGRASCRERV
mgnify:CR=1 FL=1